MSWNPAQYEKFRDERSQPFLDLMELLAPVSGAEIVDLGCGTGELTSQLLGRFPDAKIRGIDSSPEMLKKAEAFSGPQLSFGAGDLTAWKPAAPIDVVFSNAAIQWCRNHEAILAGLYAALKPGGQLAVQMPMNHDYPTHLTALKMSEAPPWAGLLREPYGPNSQNQIMLTLEQYSLLLFHLGFREQKVLTRVYAHVLESREGVIEWVKGSLLTYFESQMAKADYERFLTEFKTRVLAELPDEKPFLYPFKRLLIWARK